MKKNKLSREEIELRQKILERQKLLGELEFFDNRRTLTPEQIQQKDGINRKLTNCNNRISNLQKE